jgi:hypothetical protein
MMDFTCGKCGATAFFSVTGEETAFHAEIFIPPELRERCKDPVDSPAPMDSGEFQCAYLEAALHQALEARRG